MTEPKPGDVYCKRGHEHPNDWELLMFVDSDMVESRRFNGRDHIYRRNDWHEFDWIMVSVPAAPQGETVTVPTTASVKDGDLFLQGWLSNVGGVDRSRSIAVTVDLSILHVPPVTATEVQP